MAGGDLDPDFGIDGLVTTNLGASASAAAVVLQPDSKLLAVGWASGESSGWPSFTIVRYCADGSLDETFGEAGKASQVLFVGASSAGANAVTLQFDGKIVVVGQRSWVDPASSHGCTFIYHSDFALVRYQSDGILDGSFGHGGKKVTRIGSLDSTAHAACIQLDGKIVAAGSAGSCFALARYKHDGSLDNTFGSDGTVVTDFGPGPRGAHTLAIQPDGKLVAAGAALGNLALARYNIDGSPDRSFGAAGKVLTGIEGLRVEVAPLLALRPDGGLLVIGTVLRDSSDFVIAKFNPDGSPDTTFGDLGMKLVRFRFFRNFHGGGGHIAFALQSDGKILAGDASSQTGHPYQRFALARFNPDGSLDSSFGTNGTVFTRSFGYTAAAHALATQEDGKIVAAGAIDPSDGHGSWDFAVARYLAD